MACAPDGEVSPEGASPGTAGAAGDDAGPRETPVSERSYTDDPHPEPDERGESPATPEAAEPGIAEGQVALSGALAPGADPATAAPGDHGYYDDPYSDYSSYGDGPSATATLAPSPPAAGAAAPPPTGGGPGGEEEPDDEDGMARMSFFEHLSELRRRILHALAGLLVAFALSLTFANRLWAVVSEPAVSALRQLKVDPAVLVQIAPLEYFNVVWLKLPLLSAVFLASPWLLYQVWGFVAPGLYKKERRWAAPFVISTAGLFILGGVFAYFVVFRFALVFLLGLGLGNNVRPFVSVEAYFGIFVNVMLGVAVVFELPVLIFFLTLIRVLSPGFLLRNIRYAILAIFLAAAVLTPTPDVFNLVLFALPMCALFFVGIGASYLLILRREQRRFPWGKVLLWTAGALLSIAAVMTWLHLRFGYHFAGRFPWFVR